MGWSLLFLGWGIVRILSITGIPLLSSVFCFRILLTVTQVQLGCTKAA